VDDVDDEIALTLLLMNKEAVMAVVVVGDNNERGTGENAEVL